jgi:GNAT superfamily N-acetyltransferase
MEEVPNSRGFVLREATELDIPRLSVHHRKMFEEIWEKKGQHLWDSAGSKIEEAYSRKLSAEMPACSCKSWVIEKGNDVVASGAITIISLVPTPNDPSPKVAYLHSMYTEGEHRGNQLASRIVGKALEFCKSNGIKRAILNASEAGRPLYEKVGFSSVPEMMRILVE